MPKLIFLQNRVSQNSLGLNPANYKLLKEQHLERINAVIQYTTNNELCRQNQLLMYFNEFDFHACGHCDVCLSKRPKDLNKAKEKLVSLLSQNLYTLTQLKDKMKIYNNDTWVMALNELIDEGKVVEDENGYHLK